MVESNQKHISAYCPEETFIVELNTKSVNLICQLLHIYNISVDNNKIGKAALKVLTEQTSCGFLSPQIHGVYEDEIQAPSQCIKLKSIYYLPYE
jgi:hypothetical protein